MITGIVSSFFRTVDARRKIVSSSRLMEVAHSHATMPNLVEADREKMAFSFGGGIVGRF